MRPVSHLSCGNPHTVVGVEDVRVVDLLALGRRIPQVNLEIIEPGPGAAAITMRVHERGAGITDACGSGACASAWAAAAVGTRRTTGWRNSRAHGRWRCQSSSASARARSRHPGRAQCVRRPLADRSSMTTPYQEALGATLIERTKRERIVLVGVALPGQTDEQVDASLDELALLIDTAGADEVARLTQRRDAPDHTWFIGKGKVDELRDICLAVDADTVVFDNELAPAQQYNLERKLGRTAIDRTAVILDIFAQNAHTLEGKAQVELALLRYRLPRLRRGSSANLTQQGAGIGTRGPGETKLEVDRRRIMRRITKLEGDLNDLQHTRNLQRKGRRRSGLDAVTIVGYTNAGKSTLLNQLTRAGVLVEDRLFATLDPTTRRLALPGGEPVLLTDTVGFVRRLPHGLVQAFKSTLEVAREADILVHVVDVEFCRSRWRYRGSTHCAGRDRRARCPRAARVQQG